MSRSRRLPASLVVFLSLAVVAGAACAVRRGPVPRAEEDPPFDDEKKLRDRAQQHSPTVLLPPKDITLPEVSGGVTIAPEDLVLTVSKTMLALEGQDIVPVPADPRRGFDAKYKRSGQADLYVQPLGLALTWASKYPPMAARPAAMTLLVDRDVPYRLLVEVLFTLGQNEWVTYHLAATHAGKVVGLRDPKPPRAAGARAPLPGLGLTVLVVPDGFSVKARGGNVAPGCQDTGPGIAIPKTGTTYDYAALRACVAKVKAAVPELATETEVVISANPDTSYGTIVTTMDTLQRGELLPDVTFGIVR